MTAESPRASKRQGVLGTAIFAFLIGIVLMGMFSETGHQAHNNLVAAMVLGALPFLGNGLLFGVCCDKEDERTARLASWVVAAVLLLLTMHPYSHTPLNVLVYLAMQQQPLPTPRDVLPSALLPITAVFAANALGFALGQAWRRKGSA